MLVVEIVNVFVFYVGCVVDFGLKIVKVINVLSMDNKKFVEVGDMKFFFFMLLEDIIKIFF